MGQEGSLNTTMKRNSAGKDLVDKKKRAWPLLNHQGYVLNLTLTLEQGYFTLHSKA